jgi:hypothetical protein
MKNDIFEVDIKGLRQLQDGKPKWFIVRELLQNAMDEEITQCSLTLAHKYGKAVITVEDDSPTGFRDLSDAYTLFKETYKRSDVKKRGRFNFGEKQVLCMCDEATIFTTTGTIEFDMLKGTRTASRKKRERGSEINIVVRMTKDEFQECVDYANELLIPPGITFIVNTEGDTKVLSYKEPHKTFVTKLQTEVKESDVMKRVQRVTDVHLHIQPISYIYEMGIPICEIDCKYSIDVQQKVPLSNDRDTVDAKYLKYLYGEVLNHTIEEITPEQSSDLWVRDGFTSPNTDVDVRKDIITKRFGEKALIANPNDKRSMDEAISNGYKTIFGSELNRDEWSYIKQDSLLVSTSTMFKTGVADGRMVPRSEWTEEQVLIAGLVIKIAKEMLRINCRVTMYDSPDATVKADYNRSTGELRFNVAHFNRSEWELEGFPYGMTVKEEMLDLIIHELGHSAGWHYEHSYHECITKLAAKCTKKALLEPEWFTLK